MFRNIICCVDGSRHSERAAQAASELAARFDAKLTFLTVTKELKVNEAVKRYIELEKLSGGLEYVLDEMTEQILDAAKACAERCGVRGFKTEVKVGPPARTIVQFAERTKADTIVMGRRGVGDVEGALLGSVSHKVSSLASCGVVTVK
ncbi:universal stress protein [Ferruginivarius sediminum]|uniref:Universal stress protein n=1 Tax=Ferruginivarius sediminum TaxID=2661937 RepID=A0A369T616_9PROT|nr:universal stress protein [Ferruginivarius sediminum]RDD60708.1 universal stress protein [Ferruginivarius sediminum]